MKIIPIRNVSNFNRKKKKKSFITIEARLPSITLSKSLHEHPNGQRLSGDQNKTSNKFFEAHFLVEQLRYKWPILVANQ